MPVLERGQDGLDHHLSARGHVQQHLAPHPHLVVVGVEQDRADLRQTFGGIIIDQDIFIFRPVTNLVRRPPHPVGNDVGRIGAARAQASFELAGKRLGADVMNMSVSSSSMRKGETLVDTARKIVTANATSESGDHLVYVAEMIARRASVEPPDRPLRGFRIVRAQPDSAIRTFDAASSIRSIALSGRKRFVR